MGSVPSSDDCKDIFSIDAYSPKEMACKAESIGVTKANLGFLSTFVLGVLAGAFIGLAACFFTTTVTGGSQWFGAVRFLGGLSFSLGLILVVVAGAELFTGNTLIVIAFISGKVSLWRLLRNWAIVYVGNLAGSVATAAIVYLAWQWKMGDMAVGVTAFNVAGKKLSLPFTVALCSGTMCNALVCIAVWLCYSARSTTDKILSIILPITAFVALGFEHSVANMYFIPFGMMLARTAEFTGSVAGLGYDPAIFTTANLLVKNLLPVTIGNVIGGSIMVGVVYWIVYLRVDHRRLSSPAPESDDMVEVVESRR
jgi:formate transporter